MNVVALKWKMRKYARAHGLQEKPRMMMTPGWGSAAKPLALKITTHAKVAPSSSPVAVHAVLYPKTLAQRIVEVALSQVGVHETPYASNDGPKVHEYQKVTGAYKQPWCASFVSWCARKAGYKGKLPTTPAWVPSWASFHPCSKLKLKRGGYVCLWHSGHIEVFVRWVIPYVLAECVGGNTSPVGQNANGGMVSKTRRYATEMNAVGNVA